MATLEQLQTALVNADKAGDVQAATALAAELRRMSPETPQGDGDSGVSTMQAIGKGMRDPIDGGAQLLTKMLPQGMVDAGNSLNNWLADKTGLVGRLPEGGVDQQVRDAERQYTAARGPNAGFDWARLGGNMLSPATLATGFAGGMAAPAASLAARMGTGAALGGVTSALNPVTTDGGFAAEKGKQIAAGTIAGGLMPAVVGGVSRMISPNASTNPNVALLRNEGVRPTIGQTLGGWANSVEEKAMSIPIVGDAIAHSRDVARRQFNQAAVNRATAPINGRVQGVGQGAVQQAGDQIGDAYNAARTAMGSFQIDRQAQSEIGRLRAMVANLPEPQQRTFQSTLDAIATDVSPNGTIPAAVFKRIDSKIGQEAARFSGSPDPYHQQLGDALGALQAAITGAGRRANPRADEMFRNADRAYANLVRIEGASKAAMNTEGVFTPGQLNSAVRQADRSVRDRATARGTALMQDLGNAGQQVLGNKVPNSGTADRLMLGAGGLGAYFVDPMIPTALLGGAAMYTQPMQGLLRGAVASRPQFAQPVAEAFRQASPAIGLLGGQVGPQLLNYQR